MKPTLFLSDLHLSPERPALVGAFERFCAGPAREAAGALRPRRPLRRLDRRRPAARAVRRARRARRCAGVAAAGVPVVVMRGNRDFLLGERFAAAAGATLLPDADRRRRRTARRRCCCTATSCAPTTSTTSAIARASRDPVRSARFLRAALRRCAAAIARWLRAQEPHGDRAQARVDHGRQRRARSRRRFAQHGVARMIHGHTHRPARHELVVDGRARERLVLADWYDRGSYLEVDADGVARARRCAPADEARAAAAAQALRPAASGAAPIRATGVEPVSQRLREIGDQVVACPRCPTETRISESAMPIAARRSGPISQKIVCATGIASVRLSPRFDDEHDDRRGG